MASSQVLDLLQQDHMTPKHAAGTHGGEYHSPCPVCGGNDRFQTWPDRSDGKKTSWYCRQCDKGGDDIEYLKHVRKMSYVEACEFLGQQPRSKPSFTAVRQKKELLTRTVSEPNDLWKKKAEAFVAWSEKQLFANRDAPVWHRLQGLKDETIKHFRLGWNPQKYHRERVDWGLEEKLNDWGKPRKLALYSGLIIPNIVDGYITQIKIRTSDIQARKAGAYIKLRPGEPCLVPCTGDVFVVVESDLDAMLLWQEVRDLVGIVSLGSLAAPDETTTNLLRKAKGILLSLDTDEAGAKKAWNSWLESFPNAIRWPIPKKYGKDPGEAHENGLNLKAWVKIGVDALSETKTHPTPNTEPVGWFVINSELLGEKIILVKNENSASALQIQHSENVVYTNKEMEILTEIKKIQPETYQPTLKGIHQLKKEFGGKVQGYKRITTH